MFVLEADRVLVGGTEAAAVVLLQLDLTLDWAAVDMHVEDRHEDDDLVARLLDEAVLIRLERHDVRDCPVSRREHDRRVLLDVALRVAEEVAEIEHEDEWHDGGQRMQRPAEEQCQHEASPDERVSL